MLKAQDVRRQLEDLLSNEVAPIARRYRYDALGAPMQTQWKPIVLVIGNYSSGKSTLINELLGAPVQRTGQAPTDDCFTVLVGPDGGYNPARPTEVVEETPGHTVVNDLSLPFSGFKQFGSRFISHFVLKRINTPALENLAIIDSPGMLDSVTELDRGYDYQKVIGRLAELADLVVLVFDPHRAGTIKETYVSIRSTLPQATSEDRVVFVMNRIDECKNLSDLLRCYGVLCWNLSQMTGRKDIPRIFLTYSPTLSQGTGGFGELARERDELVEKIAQAPRLQVSHLLGAVDNHLHKLELLARTMASATERYRRAVFSYWQAAVGGSLAAAVVLDSLLALLLGQFRRGSVGRLFSGSFFDWPLVLPLGIAALGLFGAYQYYLRRWQPSLREEIGAELESHAGLDTRYARDLWDAVGPKARELWDDPKVSGAFSHHRISATRLRRVLDERMRELYEQHLGSAPPEPRAAEAEA